MQNLFSDINFSWGMLVFFVLLTYVLVSIVEYMRGSHHRRLGYWFSKMNKHGGSRSTSWPVALKGHLFIAITIMAGILIVTYVDDVRIESGLLVVWVLASYIITHKKSAR